jgi:hypothetical protein
MLMDRSAKLLMGGIILGGVTLGVGQIRVWQLEKRIEELRVECVSESKETIQRSNIQFELLCDPKDLLRSETGTAAPGIQGKLVHAQRSLNRWEISIFLGLGVLLILSVPWCWYFLLRRIREISAAIAGK